ncbi:hypothetical protein [Paracoccus sp. IB05]|uniref:hypothetical protein n=1 Tax=Paracoccus sp. IB05 TaxID=2779367 RepID=UPI0018E7EC35|nr:hypothetical protein [Paracoccus sp. IB05]MBJ2150651.1 hypothetical protein [Paracoccus sp. IB05]
MSGHPEQSAGAEQIAAGADAGAGEGGSSSIPGHHPGALAAVASSAGLAGGGVKGVAGNWDPGNPEKDQSLLPNERKLRLGIDSRNDYKSCVLDIELGATVTANTFETGAAPQSGVLGGGPDTRYCGSGSAGDGAGAVGNLDASSPATPEGDAISRGAAGLKRIVEEIDGAMNHGTWRDDHGVRLKDTPEWVALYNAMKSPAALTAQPVAHGDDAIAAGLFMEAVTGSQPVAHEPVAILRLSIERKIGMYGAAYDGPQDARAYTYQHQPGNQPAWKIGQAASAAAQDRAGDYIDKGLGLLRHLQDAGFGVFSLVKDEAATPAPVEAGLLDAICDMLHGFIDPDDAVGVRINLETILRAQSAPVGGEVKG